MRPVNPRRTAPCRFVSRPAPWSTPRVRECGCCSSARCSGAALLAIVLLRGTSCDWSGTSIAPPARRRGDVRSRPCWAGSGSSQQRDSCWGADASLRSNIQAGDVLPTARLIGRCFHDAPGRESARPRLHLRGAQALLAQMTRASGTGAGVGAGSRFRTAPCLRAGPFYLLHAWATRGVRPSPKARRCIAS